MMQRRLAAVALPLAFVAACGGAAAAPSDGPSPAAAPGPGAPPSAGAALASAAPAPSGAPQFAKASLSIQTKGGPVNLDVEIADTEDKREYGLMNRSSLDPDAGMVFVFDPPAQAARVGFWMKDTLIPLSIAFVTPDLAVESLDEMQPLSQQVHYAPRDYLYAIEANQGFFVGHGVAVGDRVTLSYGIVAASSG
jgi:uncharacterized membrane protein (UPF0127 family)